MSIESELQLLSSEIWTNYSLSDPGITIRSIVNYALLELEYKLSFDLVDYLVHEHSAFSPQQYGMFLPKEMYPTTPVTIKDYQILFLSELPEMLNIIVECRGVDEYDVKLVPFALKKKYGFDEESGIEKIKKVFHKNRNLCETLKNVELVCCPELFFCTEFEIETGVDATTILAQVYWEIISYLSGGIHYEKFKEIFNDDLKWEEWLDGPAGQRRVVIPQQESTMSELFGLLSNISGINKIKYCCLNDNSQPVKDIIDFKSGYSLHIPTTVEELSAIIIKREDSRLNVEFDKFTKELEALFLFSHSPIGSDSKIKSSKLIPSGVYRDVYGYSAVRHDFPALYNPYTKYSPEVSKEISNKQFGAYLRLFDLIILKGLGELKEMKNILSINEGTVEERSVQMKDQYLDFLDQLYKVESNPQWMKEFYSTQISSIENLNRRMRFLRNVPYLTRTRSKAYNIYEPCSDENVPTIKAHLSLLLGIGMHESDMPNGRLLEHYLSLAEGVLTDEQFRTKCNITIADNNKLSSEWECTRTVLINEEEKQELYKALYENISIFNLGVVWGDLFREGINIDNYFIATMRDSKYLLAFQNPASSPVKIQIAISDDKHKLEKWANALCCCLFEQNLGSEVVYVLEKHLFNPQEQAVCFIFSGYTNRFANQRFRDVCHRLIRTLLPAHLRQYIYWLNQEKMNEFKLAYIEWTNALRNSANLNDLEEIQGRIENLFPKYHFHG